jgi:hypothetical protein
MNYRRFWLALILFATAFMTSSDSLHADEKERSGKPKITDRNVYLFCNPMPLGLVAEKSGIDPDELWKHLRTGKTSIAAVLKKKGVPAKQVISPLKGANRKQIRYWTQGQGYSSKEIKALVERTDKIAEHFVTGPFDIKFAREHIMMAATDWGDPESAGKAMMESGGGRLLDLKYKLDVYDDTRGGQHNFAPDAMTKSEIQLVRSFGKENREGLLIVAKEASAAGAVKYARWVTSIADGTFGRK